MVIKNATIQKVVQELLGKDIITQEDVLSIKELDLQKKDITDVSDLTQFVNLEKLILTENCLSDLSPIKDLVHSMELRAGNDPFLSDEEKAKRKGKNHFIDFSFLKELTNLTHVEFTDTDIDNIDFVSMLPNIIEFWAYCNPIKSIAPLIACQKLEKAYFYVCPITDISVCRNIPKLIGIAINETDVSDISPLEGHNGFVSLDAHGAKITDIAPIKDMIGMNYLTLAATQVTDITPLLKMQELKWLTLEVKGYLSFRHIESILPELKGLYTVALHNCDFTDEQKENLAAKMPSVKVRFNVFGVWD
jgi:internalin A